MGSRRPRVHPVAVVVWAAFLAALLAAWRLAPGEAAVRAGLERLGPLAPAAFVLAEVIQVVVIPIPGQPVEVPGGYLFGLLPGLVLGSAGAWAGSMIAFGIARRYGRPWVERRVDAGVRRRFEGRLGRGYRVEWIVFWLMLVPAFPRDPLCYLAGLTPLAARRFAWIAAIGRPVGLAPWVAMGSDGIAAGVALQFWLAVVAAVLWLARALYDRRSGRDVAERQPSASSAVPLAGDIDA